MTTLLTNMDINVFRMVKTCFQIIKNTKYSTLIVYNELYYRPYLDDLKYVPLHLVSKRLILPGMPFMQIRRTRHEYDKCL